MANISNTFPVRSLARALQFAGTPSSSKSEDNDSDASSIHTNPETQKVMTEVQQTLESLKGQIPDEKWQILSKGANFFQVEMNRLKDSGRQWQRNADNMGTEFEYTSEQLEQKKQELKEVIKAKQELEQKYREQAEKYRKQGEKLKATEAQLQEEAELDAKIEQLNREAQGIQELLNRVKQ